MEATAAAGILGAMMSFMMAWSVWYILSLIARWKVLEKAGLAGWKSLIPIYSDYCTYKISWRTMFFWITFVGGGISGMLARVISNANENGEAVPAIVSLLSTVIGLAIAVINLLMNIKLAGRFGYGVLFGLGLTFLTPVFTLILGLGASEYQGNPEEGLPPRRVYYR